MTLPVDHPFRTAARPLPSELAPAVELWLDRFAELAVSEELQADAASIVRLVACSEYAANALLREWDWFCRISGPDCAPGLIDSADYRELLSTAKDPVVGVDRMMHLLRRFRHRRMLIILWRAMDPTTPLVDTMRSLSGLADALIGAACLRAREITRQKYGDIAGDDGQAMQLLTLAMGKLGGHELNFSSDIDLIFVYPGEGESDGPRSISAQEYFTRQARQLVSLLDDVTEDGFVYRVDTRLRPFGDSGPPVVSLAALESYLVQHGRGWERYAYVKARLLDDVHESYREELIGNIVRPFVYRRYLDFGVFESLRNMKMLIEAEVRKRDLVDNIKLGPGGIREVEFIVQSIQLIRGGSDTHLQTTELLNALPRLVHSRGLNASSATALTDSYIFLRRLENFIQAVRDQQTHELPTDAIDRARIAQAMGYADWPKLDEEIERSRRVIVQEFEAVAFRPDDKVSNGVLRDEISNLWRAIVADDDWYRFLDENDYRDVAGLSTTIAGFRSAPATMQSDKASANRLSEFIPNLLMLLQSHPQPTPVLQRVLKIVGRILRRSAYLALMNENPIVLRRLVDLCGESAYLAREIERYPALLDEMLDPALLAEAASADEMHADLARRLEPIPVTDSEQRVEELARFQRVTLFRIALADSGGALTIMKVSDRLTELAEIVLQEALQIAWADLTPTYGNPTCRDGKTGRVAGFGVVAYGKLGGLELSYQSDLDIVFLHDSNGSEQHTDGGKKVENNVFFGRLVRRLVHFLTTQTGSGVLYQVDTRLRPSGRSGLLVTSVDAFERYQRENAWTWEHQALLRGRAVAGSRSIADEFDRIRAAVLTASPDPERLRKDVKTMRSKMRAANDPSDADSFDLKHGTGGITDIEFLVQFLVLRNAADHPALIRYSDNIRQLDALESAGRLGETEVRALQDAYRAYRLRLHRLVLGEHPPFVPSEEFLTERSTVTGLWSKMIDGE